MDNSLQHKLQTCSIPTVIVARMPPSKTINRTTSVQITA